MSFYDFEAIKAATDILKVAEDLQLTLKKSGAGYRCECPTCGGTRGLVITPGKGYYCFAQMKGGDVIALVSHALNVGTKEAAGWLTEMYQLDGTSTRTVQSQETGQKPTVPQNEKREPTRQFNPDEYLAKLAYSDEVAALGISETDAQALGIGWSNSGMHKGIAFALRWPSGEVAGFCSVIGGEVKLPRKLIPPKVVPIKRSA